jgi:hypothetical protein
MKIYIHVIWVIYISMRYTGSNIFNKKKLETFIF